RSSQGEVISASEPPEVIHNRFGKTWQIDPARTLLYYESGTNTAAWYKEQNDQYKPIFTEPTLTPAQDSQIRQTCQIPTDLAPSFWNIAQRTCHYDISVTNDFAFGQTSLSAGDEQIILREQQRQAPLFNTSLPLGFNVTESQTYRFTFKAKSEYTTIIHYDSLHLPSSSTFDKQTGLFEWNVPKYAKDNDRTYELTISEYICQIKQINLTTKSKRIMQALFQQIAHLNQQLNQLLLEQGQLIHKQGQLIRKQGLFIRHQGHLIQNQSHWYHKRNRLVANQLPKTLKVIGKELDEIMEVFHSINERLDQIFRHLSQLFQQQNQLVQQYHQLSQTRSFNYWYDYF
ncbi:unnamed protein product, partial [Didymodactylos carnosus]